MTHSPRFSFLLPETLGVVYLVNDAVFLRRRGTEVPPLRIGSLVSEAQALTARARQENQRTAGTGVSSTRTVLSHLNEFIWTVEELIPYCRALGNGFLSEPTCPADVKRELDQIRQLTPQLRPASAQPASAVIPVSALREWLRVPCAIMAGKVVPLRKARLLDRQNEIVVIDAVPYAPSSDRALPVRTVMEATWTAAKEMVENADVQCVSASVQVQTLTTLVDTVVDHHKPRSRVPYAVLYEDAQHQVQFGNGKCALVRGPIRGCRRPQTSYAGLFVTGVTRKQLLANTPRVGPRPDLMWPPQNRGKSGSICLGSKNQYMHLHSDAFGDAEALCQWLDVARILLTRRVRQAPVPPQRRPYRPASSLARPRRTR
jgi:hypothetical protein